jgi:hypothetical protein
MYFRNVSNICTVTGRSVLLHKGSILKEVWNKFCTVLYFFLEIMWCWEHFEITTWLTWQHIVTISWCLVVQWNINFVRCASSHICGCYIWPVFRCRLINNMNECCHIAVLVIHPIVHPIVHPIMHSSKSIINLDTWETAKKCDCDCHVINLISCFTQLVSWLRENYGNEELICGRQSGSVTCFSLCTSTYASCSVSVK